MHGGKVETAGGSTSYTNHRLRPPKPRRIAWAYNMHQEKRGREDDGHSVPSPQGFEISEKSTGRFQRLTRRPLGGRLWCGHEHPHMGKRQHWRDNWGAATVIARKQTKGRLPIGAEGEDKAMWQ
eukprot:GGOE01010381.1.p4 GENE.GGOE01010381.1~~GGOE01010381.1.p4  ORF type:complete len:124 (+),score=3.07 GGOE01010381.1:254-625(+)